MCGRWSFVTDEDTLLSRYDHIHITLPDDLRSMLKPRYNIAPLQDALIITNKQPEQFSLARWGLIPSWAKDESIAAKTINARADTIQEKPAYKESFKSRRCLIPADAFYEWKDSSEGKIPYRFTVMSDRLTAHKPKNDALFSFAGLYDTWNKDGKDLTTFTIITVDPNRIVGQVHSRMPAILPKMVEREWLEETSPSKLLSLLKPYPSDSMSSIRLTTRINNSKLEGPDLIKPYVAEQGLSKFF